jgi:hypothetical protein
MPEKHGSSWQMQHVYHEAVHTCIQNDWQRLRQQHVFPQQHNCTLGSK